MANYEINEEQEVLTKAMRMIETGDPVHADVYNVLFSALLNNDVFLEKLANKMVQQAMISHVMDSTNSNMVLGADQGPVITKLIDKVQEQVTVLNTKTFLDYGNLDRIFEASANSNKDITFESDGWVIAYARTQETSGTPFVRITSNSTLIYEGFAPTGMYRYAWTPLFPVKKGAQLSFDLQVGKDIDDGQIGILFLRE